MRLALLLLLLQPVTENCFGGAEGKAGLLRKGGRLKRPHLQQHLPIQFIKLDFGQYVALDTNGTTPGQCLEALLSPEMSQRRCPPQRMPRKDYSRHRRHAECGDRMIARLGLWTVIREFSWNGFFSNSARFCVTKPATPASFQPCPKTGLTMV